MEWLRDWFSEWLIHAFDSLSVFYPFYDVSGDLNILLNVEKYIQVSL